MKASSHLRCLCQHKPRTKIILMMIGICVTSTIYFYNGSTYIYNYYKYKKFGITSSEMNACTFPELDPFDPAIKNLIRKHPPLDCTRGLPIIVFRNGSRLQVNRTKVESHPRTKNFTHCLYKTHSLVPGTDFKTKISATSEHFEDFIELKEKDEHLIVECFNKANQLISKNYISVIRENSTLEIEKDALYKTHVSKNRPKETLSILMIGTDGMSKQNFIRTMPKTREFLLNKMDALELHKFNKIGLNTFPNVVGLLAGKNESELLKEWNYKKPLDSIDHYFLWNEFKRAGYRTALMLDMVHITAFHYQKKGWTKPFVDYYNRPSVLLSEPDKKFRSNYKYCCGDQPEYTNLFDYWKQLTTTFNGSRTQPYFGYSFFCRLTHDDQNLASSIDDIYLDFLTDLVDRQVLNNTVILFFSDHGERFGRIRTTYNGIMEARTPYVFLTFPKWFHEKYPESISTLKTNQNRLTSHFDLHETMKELANFHGETGMGSLSSRGISLFKEIPIERRCSDAGIPQEYCLCNDLTKSDIDAKKAELLGKKLGEHVSDLTKAHRKNCSKLQLQAVMSVLSVNAESKASEDSGQKPGNGTRHYQITIQTTPGLAIYEATVQLSNDSVVNVKGDVARLNMYKGQAECIESSILRPFCFCIKK